MITFQVRPVRDGAIGLTLGNTEHVMDVVDALTIGAMLVDVGNKESCKLVRRRLVNMQRKGGERTRAKLAGKQVRIWSAEHGAFWRENRCGYTIYRELAGVYLFEDAWLATNHCGPEKRISFEVCS